MRQNGKIFAIFVMSGQLRDVVPEYKGLFFGPQYRRHCSYRDNPKGIRSPEIGLDTVKGDAVFYCLFLNLLEMSKSISGTIPVPVAFKAKQSKLFNAVSKII